jgi:hypothetical protein
VFRTHQFKYFCLSVFTKLGVGKSGFYIMPNERKEWEDSATAIHVYAEWPRLSDSSKAVDKAITMAGVPAPAK